MRPRKTVYSNHEIPGLIAEMRPFLSEGRLPDGTRRWSAFSRPVLGYGHLPARYRDQVAEAMYVVYSYDTPIAWVIATAVRNDAQVYAIPDVSYSPTTGQHQMACMEAWADHMRHQGSYRRLPGRGREVVRIPGNAEAYGRTIRARAGSMDGVRPGESVGGRVMYDSRVELDRPSASASAYEGTGDDASHWSPSRAFHQWPSHP